MLTIQVDSAAVFSALNQLKHAATNLEPAMRDIADELRYQTLHNFEKQGSPAWQRLSRATLEGRVLTNAKRKGGTLKDGRVSRGAAVDAKILQDTGALKNSIHPSHTANSATVSSDKKYAAIHQFGGKAGRGGKVDIPARPYLPIQGNSLTPAAQKAVLEIIESHISGAIKV